MPALPESENLTVRAFSSNFRYELARTTGPILACFVGNRPNSAEQRETILNLTYV